MKSSEKEFLAAESDFLQNDLKNIFYFKNFKKIICKKIFLKKILENIFRKYEMFISLSCT